MNEDENPHQYPLFRQTLSGSYRYHDEPHNPYSPDSDKWSDMWERQRDWEQERRNAILRKEAKKAQKLDRRQLVADLTVLLSQLGLDALAASNGALVLIETYDFLRKEGT